MGVCSAGSRLLVGAGGGPALILVPVGVVLPLWGLSVWEGWEALLRNDAFYTCFASLAVGASAVNFKVRPDWSRDLPPPGIVKGTIPAGITQAVSSDSAALVVWVPL